MNNRTSGILPDMAGIYSIILFLFLVRFAGPRALFDGDTLWHIRAGTAMLDRGELLTRDIFSHTAQGKPWIAHEWLSEIVMGALHQLGGLSAVGIFYFLLVALTFWLLLKIAERFARPWIALLCVSTTLVLAFTHLLARPHLFSWFFGVLTLYILLRNDRTLYLLIPLTALWANFHGGVLLSPALQGLFLLGALLDRRAQGEKNLWPLLREIRRPLLVLALSIAALGLNPFGYALLGFHLQVTEDIFITKIGEWQSPDLQTLWYFRYYLLAAILAVSLSGNRISWTDRLLLIFFVNASLTHHRHISLAALFLVPFWAKTLQLFARRWSIRLARRNPADELVLSAKSGPVATVVLATVLIAASGTAAGENILHNRFPLPEKFSPAAVSYLRTNPPPGRMFNDYEWGDYLIYELATEQKVFIDGRADMYGEQIFKDYAQIKDLAEDAEDLLSIYKVDWIILPADQPLIAFMKRGGGWTETYRDEKVAIVVRDPSVPTASDPMHTEMLNASVCD